jgi:hypothetical protein
MLKSGELPKPKDGYVSQATLKRQKEELEREELEEQAEDEIEDDDDKATSLANSAPVVQNMLNYSR